jgi:hypothetical protein
LLGELIAHDLLDEYCLTLSPWSAVIRSGRQHERVHRVQAVRARARAAGREHPVPALRPARIRMTTDAFSDAVAHLDAPAGGRHRRVERSASRLRRRVPHPVQHRTGALRDLVVEANFTYRVALFAEHVAVHFLDEGDHDMAELFGGHTGDEIDKFASCQWDRGPSGVPLLERCPNRFVMRGTRCGTTAVTTPASWER